MQLTASRPLRRRAAMRSTVLSPLSAPRFAPTRSSLISREQNSVPTPRAGQSAPLLLLCGRDSCRQRLGAPMTPEGNLTPVLNQDATADAVLVEQGAEPAPSAKHQAGRAVREVVETLLLAALIFFLVRLVVLNFRVDGESMLPNLDDGEMLLVNRNAYAFADVGDNRYYPFDPPKRGDIIVFDPPTGSDKPYIKRVIGLPGEEVTFGDGHVFINGELLPEDYIQDRTTCRPAGPIIAMWSFRRVTYLSLAITAATHQIPACSVQSRWGASWARPGSRIGQSTTSGLFRTSRTPTPHRTGCGFGIALAIGVRGVVLQSWTASTPMPLTRHRPGLESGL